MINPDMRRKANKRKVQDDGVDDSVEDLDGEHAATMDGVDGANSLQGLSLRFD